MRGREPIWVLIALTGVAFWLIAWLQQCRQVTAQLAALFGLAWLLAAGTFQFVIPHYDLYSQLADFAARVNRLKPADAPLHMVDLKEDQLTWYLQQPLVRVDDPEDLDKGELADRSAIYLVAPQATIEELAKEGRLEIIERSPVAPRRIESLRVSFARWQRPSGASPVSFNSSP